MILVTGATGRVGGHVVAQLLREGVEVRALARNPEAARLPDGVQVVRGDLAAPAGLKDALDGVEAVFLLWPTLAADHAAEHAIATIGQHAARIAYLSSRGVPDDNPATILGSHTTVERLIEDSGMEWTFLRPDGFASNALMWAQQIREGVVRWPYADMSRPVIHERDIAAVGVRVLLDGGHAGAKHVLTGPEQVTQADQVRLIGEAIARPVRFEELSPEAARNKLISDGWPSEAADQALRAWAEMLAAPLPVTSTVEEITGKRPLTFRDWAADHAKDFAP
jgi:uncharacterized protein YbjT (DUF2867 family)